MKTLNVLIIGAGGREHALAWKIAQSPLLNALHCAPGNGGMARLAHCHDINADDHDAVIGFCRDHKIEFVVIGPEAPLIAGLGDALGDAGIRHFGPSAQAAMLEGSKGYTKALCAEHNIPTAAFEQFSAPAQAHGYIDRQGAPLVVKADGLAAGKGVIIAETAAQAHDAVDEMFGGKFGAAGKALVIEEFLTGEEASFFALCDGKTALPLVTAQDHKRAFDGDKGPNTGGMGAYSPAPVMGNDMCRRAMSEIVEPTLKAMDERGVPYKGVLYAGLMITEQGPQLIEYNVRFGDPECQVLMMMLRSDLLEALLAVADGTLGQTKLDWHDGAALTVVMAANGYPESYDKGSLIEGLGEAAADPDVEIFHAGTALKSDHVTATGGRVLNVTARGRNVGEAQARAYRAAEKIVWPQGFYRRDIGWRAVEREKAKNGSNPQD